MATDNPEKNETVTPAPTPVKKFGWLPVAAAGAGGATLAALIAAFSATFGSKGAAPTKPAAPNRQLQIMTLYDCQYLVFDPPFTVVHHGGCTNRKHLVTCENAPK